MIKRILISSGLFIITGALSSLLVESILQSGLIPLPTNVFIFLHPQLKTKFKNLKNVKVDIPWITTRQKDLDVGWTFLPNQKLEGINDDGENYKFLTSSEGFLTPSQPQKSTKQLIVLGDSFASTYYVKNPLVWVLQKQTGTPVYNIAVGGWGPENYRESFKKFAKGRNSPIVCVFSFLNDITDVEDWNRWKAEGGSMSFYDWMANVVLRHQTTINSHDHWLDRNSVFVNWMRYALIKVKAYIKTKSVYFSNEEEFISPTGQKFRMNFARNYEFMNFDPPDFLVGGRYWSRMEAYFKSLASLKQEIESNGSKMYLIWIPSRERVYLNYIPKEHYKKYVTNQSGQIDGIELSIANFANEQQIPFLDLTPIFADFAKRGEKLYFKNDGHMNSYGNEVTGNTVADWLNKQQK